MKIEPGYLLLGPENGEKGSFIKSLKQEIAQSTGGNPEEHRFYPFETDLREIIGILRNGSLFADFKIVTVYQVETITKKGDIELLLEYMTRPAEGSLLLLISDEVRVDKRLNDTFPKNGKKIFWEMFENKKHEWVVSLFKKNGKKIGTEAVELILELISNNTLDLHRECRRLIVYYRDKDEIDPEDIETFLYHSKEENVFSLFDKIAEKDLEGALEISEKLALTGEAKPVQLLAGLLWQFKRLQFIGYRLQANFSIEEAGRKGGIFGKKALATYAKAARNYPVPAVERIISLVSTYDFLVRETRTEMSDLLFSLFLYCCIQKNGESVPALLPVY